MRKLFSILLCLFALISCNPEEEKDEKTRIFDPRVPGGATSSNPQIKDVINLKVSVTYNDVELKWTNPSIYKDADFGIHVYRVDGAEDPRNFPEPSAVGSNSFLYHPKLNYEPFKGTVYKDQNGDTREAIIQGRTYTYYVYLKKDNRFSAGKKVTVTIPFKDDVVTIPAPTEFWKNYTQRQGGKPDADFHMITTTTLTAGKPTVTEAKGGIAYAKSGTILYIADTDANRVMIYMNTLAQDCFKEPAESFERSICLMMYGNAPLTAYGVIGQANFSDTYSCQDAGKVMDDAQCLTKPTQLLVDDKDRLYIADNGNNRIKIYDTTPTDGCFNLKNLTGDATPVQCTPSRVIGQRSRTQLVTYDIATDGDVGLSCPNGMAIKNDNLYIADTCNNRVVVARNAGNPALFDCNDTNWKTSRCSFGSVLFQADLFSKEKFEDKWDDGDFSYDIALNVLVGDPTYLAKHMANPKLIKFNDGKMYIAGNENFQKSTGFGYLNLFGRVLRYDNEILEGTFPQCNPTTFHASGCNADWVYGQQGFDVLPITTFGGNYTDSFITIGDVGGFDFFDKRMFLADSDSNIVAIWNDHLTDEALGSPASIRVFNPLGVWDADNNRSQPNLGGLGGLVFREDKNGIVIFDAGGHFFYTIRIINPWN
jgi:hypothetical protein